MNSIEIKGARVHNLKNVSLTIPKNKLVVFTGVSGSGKSSLVFDTIYTEAQRQLVETFSTFARQRLPKLSRPDVDEIKNISTAIIIDQKRMGRNLRSTVGTATEIATYLRMLYSRCGEPFIGPSFFFSYNHPEGMCPHCKGLGKRITVDTALLVDKSKSLREGAITHPDFKVDGWNWRELIACQIFNVDKKLAEFTHEELYQLLYAESIPISRQHGAGIYRKEFIGIARKLEKNYIDKSEDELPEERKDAYARYFVYSDCTECSGSRINARARNVQLNNKSFHELADMELTDLDAFLATIKGEIAEPMVTKMRQVIGHLVEIGVGYLSLNRPVSTLSGGESQRVKMARQLDCDLVDMMYILDEPSIGLHAKDNDKLIEMLHKLRDKGNSVLVVEHDPDIIKCADWLVDIGPKAGREGGFVLYQGTIPNLAASDTLTSQYLFKVHDGKYPRKSWDEYFEIKEARVHNLKNVNVRIPKGIFTCVTGVAGSGKSSLIHEVFVKQHPEAVVIDQTPIGKSSRSIPVMYIGVFDLMRKEIAKAVNSEPAMFSFNSKGACEKCKGSGNISFEMNFLDDVKIVCDECNGHKYTENVLALKYKGKNIYEILNLTIAEAEEFFEDSEIKRKLKVLNEVGLDYLQIGQSLSSLSGGEAQRIKLASELHKKGNIYVMDEPTTGLHMADTDRLMKLIRNLVNKNNTVVVIEHNLDVIKQADWVIDIGPLGGKKGGEIVVTGVPEEIVKNNRSYTGQYLKTVL